MRINKKQISTLFCFLLIVMGLFIFFSKREQTYSNVLLISIDALRADHLGCYGYKRNTSPNIDGLAKDGVLFTEAISQGSWTGSSLVSILTSSYPHTHVIAGWNDSLSFHLPTLFTILKKRNYYTGFINGHYRTEYLLKMGLQRGVDFYNNDKRKIMADEISQRAISFLQKNKDRKFFLWLHYFDPHGPYRPPTPYNKRYLNDNLYKRGENVPLLTNKEPSWFSGGKIPYYVVDKGITDVDYYISQYDGAISFTDEQIGVLLKKMEELGLDNKTIIILTSDHGEGMGEHNIYFTHGVYLYDEFIKVPLIIKYRRKIPAGEIIRHQVGLIDIMPTVLSILKIRTRIRMEGVNLAPLIMNKISDFPRKDIFSELLVSDKNNLQAIKVSIRTKRWKLIRDYIKNIDEMYDLDKDPRETTNIINMEKGQHMFLKTKLKEWVSRSKINPVD